MLNVACVLCLAPAPGGLCRACRRDLPWSGPACALCARPLPAGAGPCGACLRRPPPQAATRTALRYAPPIDALIARYKFDPQPALAAPLARLMRGALRPHAAGVAALVPVPLHPRREAERGFNQAALLARALGRLLGRPLWPEALRRGRDTAVQSRLPGGRRRANVRDAFRCPRPLPPLRLALVDDVLTSGATAEAAVQALLRAGAAAVEVWVLARAAPPR